MARLTRLMILLFTLCYGPAILVLNGLVSAASTGPSGDARIASTRSSLAIAAWEMRAMDKLMEEIRRRQEVCRKLFLIFYRANFISGAMAMAMVVVVVVVAGYL
jgi:hypothetical protein